MLKIINDLFKLNRTLVGDGFDKALQYIKKILPEMEILEYPTGMEYGTWTIPQKWEIKDAWVKYKDKKVLDYKKEPLSLIVGKNPNQFLIFLNTITRNGALALLLMII